MGWKNTLGIHLGFWFYLFGGGVIYYYIEYPVYYSDSSPESPKKNDTFCQKLLNLAIESYPNDGANNWDLDNEASFSARTWLAVVKESCNNLTDIHQDPNGDGVVNNIWEYSSALFLCMTIVTTVGHGNFSPKTNGGKVFCILYGLIGIPVCGILLASTSNYFSSKCMLIFERQKRKHITKGHRIVIAAFVFLLPGLAVFLFVPAAIFTVLEDWTYLDSVYFSFITVTTIGFGDIVAAQQPNSHLLWFYRICLIIWIILGIAYWAIIIGFIIKAFKSRKLRQRWEKTSHAITEQAKEMRKAMEELSIMNAENHEPFVAPKTKAALDFAVKMVGNVGHLGPDIERQQSLPGVTTAFHPHNTSLCHGLIGIMEFPIMLDQQKQDYSNLPPALVHEEKVEASPLRPLLTRQNANSTSTDSGYDDIVAITSDDTNAAQICNPPNETEPFKESKQPETLSQSSSSDSLSPSSEPRKEEIGEKENKLKMVPRNRNRPETNIQKTPNSPKNPQLSELVLEAMMILNEAEASGTSLTK